MQPEKSLPKLAIVALTIVMASIMSEAAYSQGVSTPDSLCPWRGALTDVIVMFGLRISSPSIPVCMALLE